MRVALITASFGSYDPVRQLPDGLGFDETICVTDAPDAVPDCWTVVTEPPSDSPRLASKRPKMMPWLYTGCDAAVWVDSSFEVTSALFGPWAREHLERDSFVTWVHPEGRTCLGQEADVCWMFPKYEGQPIREQAAHYFEDGMPRTWGLFAAGVLGWVFDDATRAFGEAWYAEQTRWTIQDQISLPWMLWSTGLPFGVWRANEYENPYVRVRWDERPTNDR